MPLRNVFGSLSLESTQQAIKSLLELISGKVTKVNTDDVKVTNFPTNQEVSGTIDLSPETIAAINSGQTEITGVATETTLSSINGKIPSIGQKTKTGSISVTLASDTGSLPVSISGTPTVALDSVSLSAIENISVSTDGVATESTLNSISNRIPSIGQKNSGSSIPVVLASDQPIVPVSLASVPNHPVTISGIPTVSLDSASLAALENITAIVSGNVEISNDSGNPIPVTGTIALDSASLSALENISNNTSGSASETTLSSINSKTPSLGQSTGNNSVPVVLASDKIISVALDSASLAALETVSISGNVSVTGSLTNTELRSAPIEIVANELPEHPVTISGIPTVSLDSASLAALETISISSPVTIANSFATENTVTSILNKLPSVGSATKTSSIPVVLASDHPIVPVSLSSMPEHTVTVSGVPHVVIDSMPVQAVTLSGAPTVSLDAVSLAALENVTATINGSVIVTGPLTNSQLRESPVPISVSNSPTVALNTAALDKLESIRSAVSATSTITGNVEISNDSGNPIPVTGNFTIPEDAFDNMDFGDIAIEFMPVDKTEAGDIVIQYLPTAVSQSNVVSLDTASLAALENINATIIGTPTVTLDAASLAALETIQIGNQISGYATESTLASINSKTPSLGQSNKTGSVPVTIASDQGNVNVAVSSIIPITLDETSLSALEDINASISGNVGISSISESATVGTWVEDLYVRTLLRKLMQLKYNSTSDLMVAVNGGIVGTVGTVTTLTTMATGNIGFGDAGKAASYQQVSAITGNMNRRCFQWE